MPISVVCPTCGTKLKAPDTSAGKKVKCPKCAILIPVPAEDEEASTSVSAEPPPKPKPKPTDDEPEDLDEVPEAGDEPPDDEDEDRPRKKKRDAEQRGGPLREDDKTWGMFAHLAGALFGWAGALVVFLMKKDESAFLRHHSKESLNFQLTLLPIWLVLPFGWCCMGCMGNMLDAVMGSYGLVRLGVWGLMSLAAMALGGTNLALTIMAALKAKKGEWNKYPFSFRLIK